MEKWGWIPDKHGNSTDLTVEYRKEKLDPTNPADLRRKGLTIIYDDRLSLPLDTLAPFRALRTDEYGRPLPIAPKLPVSPQILYMGKPT
jgi:hypothetical protein